VRTAMRRAAGVAVMLAGLALGHAAPRAHHSHSMFDMSREVTITGTVTAFSYRNPHVFLHVDVKDPKGQVTAWAVEMSNIGNMQSRGIHLSTFKVGDVVTVKINPLKDGRFGGNYTSVTAADGKTYE
jgi:DNA/RNA endonuclease YhcR with UshA esterase domain